jgi:hypothetical protein
MPTFDHMSLGMPQDPTLKTDRCKVDEPPDALRHIIEPALNVPTPTVGNADVNSKSSQEY